MMQKTINNLENAIICRMMQSYSFWELLLLIIVWRFIDRMSLQTLLFNYLLEELAVDIVLVLTKFNL